MVKEWHFKLNKTSYAFTLKKFLQFNKQEMRAIIIAILILTFIVGFNDGGEVFVLSAWLLNFLKWLIIVTISFLSFVLGQRLFSLWEGYIPEFRLWWYGLMIGLIVSFVSRGHIWLLLPGGMFFHQSTTHRIGEFRYGQNIFNMSKAALGGPIAVLLLGILVKTIQVWFGFSVVSTEFVHEFYLFCMALGAFSLLPIPPLVGSKLFFESRMIYAFVAGSFIAYSILVFFNIYSIIFALIIGVIVWLLFFSLFEKGGWHFDEP